MTQPAGTRTGERRLRRTAALCCSVIALNACSSAGQTTAPDASAITAPATEDAVGVVTSTTAAPVPMTSVAVTSVPATSVPATSVPATSTTLPSAEEERDAEGSGDEWYVYAEAGAKAVLGVLDDSDGPLPAGDALEEILVDAAGAAYELEYPVDVVYLDAAVEYAGDEPVGVSVSVGDDEDDRRATAYVCLSDGRARVTRTPCDTAS